MPHPLPRALAVFLTVVVATAAPILRAEEIPATSSLPSIFNGRDLTGWTPPAEPHWKVVDGILVGEFALRKTIEPRRGIREEVFPAPDAEEGLIDRTTLFDRSFAEEPRFRIETTAVEPGEKPRDSEMDRRDAEGIEDDNPQVG
jgi:hypothetical protein